jgi:Ca2+-binding RTX toxin-like protein
VLTEGHARDVYANAVTNGDASLSFDNPYLRALDWFGRNGIGFSWWPATFEAGNPASQALLRPLADGSLLRFENNLFWARNAWQVDRGGRGDARAGDDRLAGGGEDDFLYGGAGSDQLVGLGGDDLLEGGEGDDLLSGGAGNDTLVGGAGRDNMTGGAGADLFVFRNDPGADGVADFRPGVDAISVVNVDFARLTFVRVGADTDVRLDGRTIVTLKSVAYTPNSADFDQIRFGRIVLDANGEETDVDDTLTGGAGDDRLHGGRGDDRLFGLAGADTLNGGEGSNRLTGGAGADLFMLGGHRREAGATLAQVTDFVDGVDRIGVATPNLRFADLRIARDGADARIATPDGEDVAIVLGAAGRIDASDFVFGL